jgi:hypothetical protein
MNDLPRRRITLRPNGNLAKLCTNCSKPWGEGFEQLVTSRRNSQILSQPHAIPSPIFAHCPGSTTYGSKNRVCTNFAALPITLNPPQANDLQRSIPQPRKTQNSKIPERHTLLESKTQNQCPKPPAFIRFPSPQPPLSLVFTHSSTYHRKVYGRSSPRTSPGHLCLPMTRHSPPPLPHSHRG